MSEKQLSHEVGDIITIGKDKFKVIGTDNSKVNQSAKKWDYWLKNERDELDIFRITEERLVKLQENAEAELKSGDTT